MRTDATFSSASQDENTPGTTAATVRLKPGDHTDIPSEALLPYRLLSNLGLGASATVEKVEDVHTHQVYARKVFRNTNTRHVQEVKIRFLNEVQIMRKLSHRHFVRLVVSYTCGRALGILLEPVADDGDLCSFLTMLRDQANPITESQSQILTCAFGCLATGLSFMHSHTIRHKDIKPQNILIHRGSVLYTDFGISRDFSLDSRSTTAGAPGAFTKRYAAPEVVDWDKRNSKSDIFSLGCVYFEILTTLRSDILPDDILGYCYHQVIGGIASILNQRDEWSTIRYACLRMVARAPESRPSADQIAEILFEDSFMWQSGDSEPFFCSRCCRELRDKPSPQMGFETVEHEKPSITPSSLSGGSVDPVLTSPRWVHEISDSEESAWGEHFRDSADSDDNSDDEPLE